ncbi:pleckstrin homology domain-containing family A member 2 [Clupea harengus]|uniref:Pleckstrin homology domain-containing family A member 2 n=1 Tax=Clupea harengus TaxID=7950 RepID=A0A6P3W7F5_CLUHA|nr:pleckstrin homology domain-containing family A member 2 [Clupea harengus]
MPYLDRQDRICGFLDIEENENSDKFYRRYLILDTSSNFLYWYMDNPQNLPKGAECVGSVRLTYISKVSEAATKQKPKAEFCFVINALSRRYFLQANDAVDLKEWVIALNRATKITVPKVITASQSSDVTTAAGKGPSAAPQAYKAEIVGGVVVHTPITQNESDGGSSDRSGGEGASSVRLRRLQNSRPNIVRCGYCVKQGNVRKSWKRRFFILDDQAVSYFKHDTDKEPLRSIRLLDITKVHECLVKSGELLMRDNLFEIITTARTFYIQTDTPEDMHGWIKDIGVKIQDFRGPSKESLFPRSTSQYRHSTRSSQAPQVVARSKPSLVKTCSVTSSWQPWTPVPACQELSKGKEESGKDGEKERDSPFASLPSLLTEPSDAKPRQRHCSQPQPASSRDFPFHMDTGARSTDV